MYVGGSETLTITGSVFTQNEVGTGELGNGAGGDVWACRNVELTVTDSTFSNSAAEYGGAAIVCCGAEIVKSVFSSTDVASTEVSPSVRLSSTHENTTTVRWRRMSVPLNWSNRAKAASFVGCSVLYKPGDRGDNLWYQLQQ